MTNNTKRVTSEYLEGILNQQFDVLDHGFIRVVDYLGDESAIIRSARVSYGSGTRSTREDVSLLRYLMRNRHTTPFESCEIQFHMKLPIFVARQLIRHRTANVNEYSARYSILDKEFYIPADADIQPQSTDNKQGRSGELNPTQKMTIQSLLSSSADQNYCYYLALLGEKDVLSNFYNSDFNSLTEDEDFPGIARELARMVLPLNFYTQWHWKIDLHNLLHFLSLRADAHAQKEIRVYAEKILEIVQGWLPNVYQAFMDYHPNMDAMLLSGPEWQIIRKYLLNTSNELPTDLREHARISKREAADLTRKIFG